jgi:hypothetical protein
VIQPVDAPFVRLDDLRVGDLLAEGGEGRVHQLPRQPHLVYKAYRRPDHHLHLEDLIAWPGSIGSAGAATVQAAASWPCSVVAGPDGEARGLLMPRAPRRFAVRHRDGHSRLASLSYLTTDPGHRAVAYGLQLPPPVSSERVGLVYALARLLAAFESGDPAVGHGDLSTKNVLWSLQRGPEVFVIDCDNCERFGADGASADAAGRRRAMTPNWDDPAVHRGGNPLATTDRYSLALIVLRIVGAANFPIQAGQRAVGPVEVRFAVPPGPAAATLLDPDAPLWDLCGRSLDLSCPEARPPASAWLGPLEALLDAMGAAAAVQAVRAAQGGGAPAVTARPTGPRPTGVRIVPEPAPRQARTWAKVRPAPRYGPAATAPAAAIGYRWIPVTGGRAPGPNPASAQPRTAAGFGVPAGPQSPVGPELKAQARRFLQWWLSIHVAMVRSFRASGRPGSRIRAVGFCLVIDFVALVLVAAFVAVAISPVTGG